MATSAKRRRAVGLIQDEEGETELELQASAALFKLSSRSFARIMAPAENERDTTTETNIMPSSSSDDLTRSEQNQPTTTEMEVDDSDETLDLVLRWIKDLPEIPPENIISMVGQRCSAPVWKQLTKSDVEKNQNRLMFGKKQFENNFQPLLEQSEILRMKEGIRVSVYGPYGVVHEMMFKMWNKNTPVLMSGWHNFVQTYELQVDCSFLTIWMFRDGNTISFAIDSTTLIRKQLSKRISRILASKDSNQA